MTTTTSIVGARRLAGRALLPLLLAFPVYAQQPPGPQAPRDSIAWLRDMGDSTSASSTTRERGWVGRAQAPTFTIPDTVKPHRYMQHVFGRLAPDSAAYFFDQAVVDSATERIFRAAREGKSVDVDAEQFYRLVGSLRVMSRRPRVRLPAPTALRDAAMQVYKLSGVVAMGVIDVDVHRLAGSFSTDLGVTSDGRLVARGPVRYDVVRLFVAAPLIGEVPVNYARLVLDDRFIFRELRQGARSYELAADGRRLSLGRDNVAEVKFGSGEARLTVTDRAARRSATARLKRGRLVVPAPSVRLAALQKLGAAPGERRFLRIASTNAGSMVSLSVGDNESWTPEVGGSHSAGIYGPDKWGGVEIGVWWSARNTGVPDAERVVEPLIIVGGQDRPTTEPQSLYLMLRDRLGDVALDLLRQRFDIFVFGYWAGGSNDDCSDPEGNASGCRAQGIERPILDNAAFVADGMRFIYSHYNIQKKATVIGISMGGIVTRMAFLGIENGPITHLGTDAFKSIPGFPAKSVPVRVWITLDSPHQGAYLPLAVQNWISSVSWLPGMDANTRLLDAASSLELLREHHTASADCAVNCTWPDALQGARTTRAAAPERGTMLAKMNAWGGFPRTVDTSIAVASGSFELPRLSLWKLDAAGRIPLTYSFCFPTTDACTEIPDTGAPDNPLEAFVRALSTPINNFDVAWGSIGAVANPTAGGLTGYTEVGPHSVPLHSIDTKLYGTKGDLTIQVRLYSLMSEVTYAPTTIDQIREPLDEFDVSNGGSLGKAKHFRSRIGITVSGEVSIPGPDKHFNINGMSQVLLPKAGKPAAFEPGGFRNTVGDIDATITESFGEAISAPYSPRHTFVPTVSALDLGTDFLSAAYQTRVSGAALDQQRYGRAKERGSFAADDFLDWKPFQNELEVRGSNCIYPSGPRTIRKNGSEIWSGAASPFTWLVCQSESLEHTFLEERAGVFLIERIFNEPPRFAGLPPVVEFRALLDFRLDRLPPILPPLPWPEPRRTRTSIVP
jgi:hypothetical protein